ncbi:MAG: hypothetical protein AAFP70_11395 [Calditrichota bacterium]
MTPSNLIDLLFILLSFLGVWIFSTSASALRVLIPQQITDLQTQNRVFANTVSWLANRQNHSIRISIFANFCLILLAGFLAIRNQFVMIMTVESIFLAVVLPLLIIMIFSKGISALGTYVGKTYPIQAIQLTAFPTKIGYLILYPLLTVSYFFPNHTNR